MISYQKLLEVYFRQVNPTDNKGQFVDRGPQYRPAIFYRNQEEKNLALKAVDVLGKAKVYSKKINLEITPYKSFYDAEKYHQNYYKKNPIRYNFYRSRSGRDDFLKPIWNKRKNFKIFKNDSTRKHASINSSNQRYTKPPESEIRKMLTPLQYKVTQKEGTERPFKNAYWDLKKEGIYVDIVSGEPLFSSKDKFKSGTGWPSFTKPLIDKNITEHKDTSLFSVRTEVRSKYGDSHLGHVFDDGPKPTGKRYCVNSASLKFIPTSDLKKQGYSEFVKLFKTRGASAP